MCLPMVVRIVPCTVFASAWTNNDLYRRPRRADSSGRGLCQHEFWGRRILAVGSIAGGDERSLVGFNVSALSGQFSQIDSITLRLFVDGFDGNANLNTRVHAITPANRASGARATAQQAALGRLLRATTPGTSGNFRPLPGPGRRAWEQPESIMTRSCSRASRSPAAHIPRWERRSTSNSTARRPSSRPSSIRGSADNVGLSQPNPGLLLFDPNGPSLGGANRVRFESSENANANLQPQLIVEFSAAAVPEPASVVMWSLLGVAVAFGGGGADGDWPAQHSSIRCWL